MAIEKLSEEVSQTIAELDDMFYSTGEISYVDYMAARNRALGNFTTKAEMVHASDAFIQGEISDEDFRRRFQHHIYVARNPHG